MLKTKAFLAGLSKGTLETPKTIYQTLTDANGTWYNKFQDCIYASQSESRLNMLKKWINTTTRIDNDQRQSLLILIDVRLYTISNKHYPCT